MLICYIKFSVHGKNIYDLSNMVDNTLNFIYTDVINESVILICTEKNVVFKTNYKIADLIKDHIIKMLDLNYF